MKRWMKRLLIALPIGLVSLLVGGAETAVLSVAVVAPVVAGLLRCVSEAVTTPPHLPNVAS